MNFETVESRYRPTPFWSWNEKLDTEETARQVCLMGEAGIGGFFMHARGGLQTPYMGEEWHENIRSAIAAAGKYGMIPWVYDEDGWPSGFGGGIVSGMGVEYQQKYLRIEAGDRVCETTVCHADGYHLYYEVNPFYVDTLDEKVVKLFIDRIYRPYAEQYGNAIAGFFTDEPQVSRYVMPWSFVLPQAYRERYGDGLEEHLPELFYPIGDYQNTRFRFWKLITDLFSESYMKQIHTFCHAHSLRLTGHLLLEESMQSQILSNGAIMPHYEYFDIPGMDWLGKNIKECLTPLQVSSVAHQLGKKQVLSETFAGCGHNVGHDELKGLYEWQMVHGINLLCQHLNGYSLRGLRKRDYPPALNYQQPWWKHYRKFNDTVARIGKLLAEGTVAFDTLLIHPQTSAWLLFDSGKNEGLEELDRAFLDVIKALECKHVCFHLGDETVMERHAYVDGAALVIGTQRYTKIILPRYIRLFESTERLLAEYRRQGGVILSAEDVPANPIVDNPRITYTERILEGQRLCYFVNTNPTEQTATIGKGSKRILPETGEVVPFYGSHTFAPYGSLLILDDGSERQEPPAEPKKSISLRLGGDWQIVRADDNAITLDRCAYWFDGELQGSGEYILSVMQKALALERPVRVKLRFTVYADYKPETLYLVTETPQYYTIRCNGILLNGKDCGYYLDRSFRKLDASAAFRVGENELEAEMDFTQSPEVYERIRQAYLFEVEKNRFTCDRELEAFYLIGDFGVACRSEWIPTERNASLVSGDFVLTAPVGTVTLRHLEQQGYPFFAGSLTLQREFDWDGSAPLCLAFAKHGVNCAEVECNGDALGSLMWEPLSVELTEHLRVGRNCLRLTLTNNLRNLLGPHHCGEEPEYTRPGSFQKDSSFWLREPVWDERYCFTEFGLSERK